MIIPNEERIDAIQKALQDMIATGTGVVLVGKEGVSYVVHEDRIEELKDDNN
jgi:hypothetical protein